MYFPVLCFDTGQTFGADRVLRHRKTNPTHTRTHAKNIYFPGKDEIERNTAYTYTLR